MKFKQMLKDELKGKGWLVITSEAVCLVGLLAMGYLAFLAIGAFYVPGN